MKIRNGFVANSSSSSFIVSANTPEAKDMITWLKKAGVVIKVDSNWLDEIIADEEIFENFDEANRLRILKENENAYEVTCDYDDELMERFVKTLCDEMNGFDMEFDLS